MVNRVVLVGRLTKDPELRYSSSNIPMLYFSVAVNRTFTDQNGQRQADFINCVAFRKQAENMARFLGRGSLISVEGRIQTRNYQGKDGNTVYVTEVVAETVQFLESKNSSHSRQKNGFDSMSFNQPQSQPAYNNNNNQNYYNNNTNQNFGQANSAMQDFINDSSSFSDFGENFPSNLDDDFMQDVVNPFKED